VIGLADLAARVRPAIVGVSAGAAGGSGYVARANGVIAATHRSVGYQLEALLDLDDGRQVAARVVAVDVARGVAFLLPKSPIAVAPLKVAPAAAPRLGDSVLALGRSGREPLAIAPGIVCAVGPSGERERRLRIDAALDNADGGHPVVDTQGRIVGLAPGRGEWLVTAASYEADLAALDVPPAELAERGPSYACPSCDEPFSLEIDRCLGCGAVLPHARVVGDGPVPGERAAKDILATLGVVANKVRVGPRAWRVLRALAGGSGVPAQVTLRLDEEGQHVVCRVPLARLPAAHHEALYRLLLTLNDQTTGLYHLSLAGDIVALSFTESTAFLRERDVAAQFQDLLRNAEHYRKVLGEAFGVAPMHEITSPGATS